jgi:hypothetical protein
MSYGFDKAKKPLEPPASAEKKLDMTGLDMSPPAVTPEQEAAVVAKGDALGFGPREAVTPTSAREPQPGQGARPVRKRRAVPTKSILVKGPEGVMNRFVIYANESGAGAYWEALDGLLKLKGR